MGILLKFNPGCCSLLVNNSVLTCLFDWKVFVIMGIVFLFDPVCYSLLVTNPVLACLLNLEESYFTISIDGSCFHEIVG